MSNKEEKVKLILQFLRQYKHEKSFNSLQNQSQVQLDPENLYSITNATQMDDYDQLEILLNHYVDETIKNKCMLIVLEQRFLKLLKLSETSQAVILLRTQISKYCKDESEKHRYASLVFNQDLVLKTEEQIVNEIISLCYKQIGLIEPNRLITLMQQSEANQILECQYHTKLEQNYSFLKNHDCTKKLDYFTHANPPLQVSFCTFSSNGEFYAVATQDNSIIISQYNQNKNSYIQYDKIQDAHKNSITFLIFSPCNKYLGSTSEDCTALIYNIHNKKKFRLEGHSSTVQCCNFIQFEQIKKSKKNDYIIYTLSVDGWLYEWNETERRGGLKIEEKLLKLHSHQRQERMLLISQNKISLYELFTKSQINQISTTQNIINSLTDSSFKQLVVQVTDNYPKLYLYEIQTLQLVKVFYGFETAKTSVKIDFGWFNDNLIVGGTNQGSLLVWHTQKQSYPVDIVQVSEQNIEITCLKFHPKKHQLHIFLNSEQQKLPKNEEQVHQSHIQQLQNQHQSQSRDIGGVQQILNLLQRIARANPMERRQRMQEEEQESSDEDM